VTDVSLIRIDSDLLDIMLTWDQLATPQATPAATTDGQTKAASGGAQ